MLLSLIFHQGQIGRTSKLPILGHSHDPFNPVILVQLLCTEAVHNLGYRKKRAADGWDHSEHWEQVVRDHCCLDLKWLTIPRETHLVSGLKRVSCRLLEASTMLAPIDEIGHGHLSYGGFQDAFPRP